MKRIAMTISAIVLWIGAFGQNNSCKEPFFSEMIEGNAPNRALEIFNPSDTAIDLNNFSIRLFQNGQLTPLIIPLSGTLDAKSTFVIAHNAAKPEVKSKADMLDPQLTFDGNDAIVLERTGGTQVDKIGEVGVNPGNAGWVVPPSGSTKEQTLRRKKPIGQGQPDWVIAKTEWEVHPKDSVSNLKKHVSTACQLVPSLTWASPGGFIANGEGNNNDVFIQIAISSAAIDFIVVDIVHFPTIPNCESTLQPATFPDDFTTQMAQNITWVTTDQIDKTFITKVVDDGIPEPTEVACYKMVLKQGTATVTTEVKQMWITDNDPTGIYEENINNINLYPTFTDGSIHIEGFNKTLSVVITVRNSLGEKVNTEIVYDNGNKLTFDVSSLAPSVYFVRIEHDNIVTTRKFIKL